MWVRVRPELMVDNEAGADESRTEVSVCVHIRICMRVCARMHLHMHAQTAATRQKQASAA